MSTVGLVCTVLSCALPPIGESPPDWVNVSGDGGTRICSLPLMGLPGVGFMSTVGLLCTVLSCALPPIGVSPPGWVNVSR